MEKIALTTQNTIIGLRKKGLSHRQIARQLGVSVGSAFVYAKKVTITTKQHLRLKQINLLKSLSKFSQDQLLDNSHKGGINTETHFPIRHTKQEIIHKLHLFYQHTKRIPTKRDFIALYRPTLRIFKTWNQAIMAAGFTPNPVLFAKKYIANDGHRCDSLSEKIIDDWLKARKIHHVKNVHYPQSRFTADFKIGNTYVEFFGLHKQLKSYDKLMQRKLLLIKKLHLKMISIYPKDIFPHNQIGIILSNLTNI